MVQLVPLPSSALGEVARKILERTLKKLVESCRARYSKLTESYTEKKRSWGNPGH